MLSAVTKSVSVPLLGLTLIKTRDDAAGAIGQLQGWGLCSSITFKLTTQVTQIL